MKFDDLRTTPVPKAKRVMAKDELSGSEYETFEYPEKFGVEWIAFAQEKLTNKNLPGLKPYLNEATFEEGVKDLKEGVKGTLNESMSVSDMVNTILDNEKIPELSKNIFLANGLVTSPTDIINTKSNKYGPYYPVIAYAISNACNIDRNYFLENCGKKGAEFFVGRKIYLCLPENLPNLKEVIPVIKEYPDMIPFLRLVSMTFSSIPTPEDMDEVKKYIAEYKKGPIFTKDAHRHLMQKFAGYPWCKPLVELLTVWRRPDKIFIAAILSQSWKLVDYPGAWSDVISNPCDWNDTIPYQNFSIRTKTSKALTLPPPNRVMKEKPKAIDYSAWKIRTS